MVFEKVSDKFREKPEILKLMQSIASFIESEARGWRAPPSDLHKRNIELAMTDLSEILNGVPHAFIGGFNVKSRYEWRLPVEGSRLHVREPVPRRTHDVDGALLAGPAEARRIERRIREQSEVGFNRDIVNGSKRRLDFTLDNVKFEMNVGGAVGGPGGAIPSEDIVRTAQAARLGSIEIPLASEPIQVFAKLQALQASSGGNGSARICFERATYTYDVVTTVFAGHGSIQNFLSERSSEISTALKKDYLRESGVKTPEQFKALLLDVTRESVHDKTSHPTILRRMRDGPLLGCEREEIKRQIRDGLQHRQQRVRAGS